MPIKFKLKQRFEGEIIPEGVSFTDTYYSVYIIFRHENEIARIRLPKLDGSIWYTVEIHEAA